MVVSVLTDFNSLEESVNKVTNFFIKKLPPLQKHRTTTGDNSFYLLMQRDRRKHYGGMWEATAGGSALQNETPVECAVRELYEETGIPSRALTEVGRVLSGNTIYVEFLCVTDCRKDSVRLQVGETIAYRWVSKEQLLSMKKEELVTERMQEYIEELQTGCERGDGE